MLRVDADQLPALRIVSHLEICQLEMPPCDVRWTSVGRNASLELGSLPFLHLYGKTAASSRGEIKHSQGFRDIESCYATSRGSRDSPLLRCAKL
jgi:hypothetical protein